MTLFFPSSEFSQDLFCEEMKKETENFKSFTAHFKTAILIPEKYENELKATIFLVPDQGYEEIVKLHDKIYSGKFKSSLRLDIPFIPHITIGAGLELTTAKNLVDQLNSRQIDFFVKIDHFDIVKIEGQLSERKIIARINLLD